MTAHMRVALLVGPRGEGLERFLERTRRTRWYTCVGAVVTTPESTAIPILHRLGVPWQCHDIHTFYRAAGRPLRDLHWRRAYDHHTWMRVLKWSPTHIVLFRYIYIVTPVLLERFPMRILNVHDSDLTVRDARGMPRYVGLHATLDAIVDGVRATHSTVHFVTETVDCGPAIAISPPYPVHRALLRAAQTDDRRDILRAYAYAHREWMIRDGWGRLLHRVLCWLATGRVRVRNGRVWIDHRPAPIRFHRRPRTVSIPHSWSERQ